MLLDFSVPAASEAAPGPSDAAALQTAAVPSGKNAARNAAEAPDLVLPLTPAVAPADIDVAPLLPLPAAVVGPPKRPPGRPPRRSRQPPPYPVLSAVRGMWLFAMFDLPVETKTDRRNYTRFRKALLAEGFMMLQFSVYAIYCASDEVSEKYRRRVRSALPPAGQVRLVAITDLQFGKMDIFFGKSREKPEESPAQLVLF